jgi:hypothetical protein
MSHCRPFKYDGGTPVKVVIKNDLPADLFQGILDISSDFNSPGSVAPCSACIRCNTCYLQQKLAFYPGL